MLPKTIPHKLPGTVHEQYVRCGKPNCRCAQGQLHGPYYYRFWRDRRGRLHKEYVRKADVEAVRAACDARRQEQREALRVLAEGARVMRWLGTGKAEDISDDPFPELDMLRMVDQLARMACGEFGEVRHSIRAAEMILPYLAAGFSHSGV